MVVGCRLAISCHSGIVQSQSGRVVGKGKHNMNETDTRFIGSDDRLCHLALALEFFKAALNRGQLTPQSGRIFYPAACKLRFQFLALLLS